MADPGRPVIAPLTDRQRSTVVLGVAPLAFLASLDQLIVAPALPQIGARLGDIDLLPWVVTAFLLAATITTPLYGRLGDIYGRRVIIPISLAILMLGSLLCALAPTVLLLALARAVQGAGAGGLNALLQAAIADAVPPVERGRYQAYLSAVYIAASLSGPLLGGFLSEYFQWQLIFWINLPLGALAWFLSWRELRLLPDRRVDHPLDIIGAALLAAATFTLLLALGWGGVRYPWLSPYILGLIAAAVALAFAYLAHARRIAEPLVPFVVMRNRVVSVAAAVIFFQSAAFIGTVAYLPIYLELVLDMPSTAAGGMISLMPLVGTGASLYMSRRMARGPWVKRMAVWAVMLGTLATATLALIAPIATAPQVAGLLIVFAIGCGFAFPLANISAQNAVEHGYVGVAAALINFSRNIGSAVAGALLGAILVAGGQADEIRRLLVERAGAGALAGGQLADTYSLMFAAICLCGVIATVLLSAMEYRTFRSTI